MLVVFKRGVRLLFCKRFVTACSSLYIGLKRVEPLYIHSIRLIDSKLTCTNELSIFNTVVFHQLPLNKNKDRLNSLNDTKLTYLDIDQIQTLLTTVLCANFLLPLKFHHRSIGITHQIFLNERLRFPIDIIPYVNTRFDNRIN